MRVGFFVTCLVDLMRPSIGFAAIELLEAGGALVFVPPNQTCCGQPAYNSGDRKRSRRRSSRSSRAATSWSPHPAPAAA
jgi:L-lactate dehydrogenase complex protein LldE